MILDSPLGIIDIIEYVMDRMHVPPDAQTCIHVFSVYEDCKLFDTAIEALQVMSVNMLSKRDIEENESIFADDFNYGEDSQVELKAVDLFRDSKENVAVALLNLRGCAIMGGDRIPWLTGQSRWVRHMSDANWCR